jgi:hypothetical protein
MQTNDRTEIPATNSTYPNVAVQWLNHPDSYRDCASIKVCAGLTVLTPSVARLCQVKIIDQKIEYIHHTIVEAAYVANPESMVV